jgi:hypothetical protein
VSPPEIRPPAADLGRFLEATRDGRDEAAERELAALFRELPRPRPSAGFAARVLARLPKARPSIFARPAARWTLGATTAAAALAAGLLLPAVGPLVGLVGPAGALHLFVVSFADLVAQLAHGLALWSSIASVTRTLRETVLHPEVLSLLVLQLALAATALRALAALALPERSRSHVSA